jgi:hypothetical protein
MRYITGCLFDRSCDFYMQSVMQKPLENSISTKSKLSERFPNAFLNGGKEVEATLLLLLQSVHCDLFSSGVVVRPRTIGCACRRASTVVQAGRGSRCEYFLVLSACRRSVRAVQST